MITLCMFRSGQDFYIQSDEKGVLCAFESPQAALKFLGERYHYYMNLSQTWATSTVLFETFFAPRIIQVPNMESLKSDVVVLEKASAFSIHKTMGSMIGVRCEGPKTKELYQKGLHPKLFVEDQLH